MIDIDEYPNRIAREIELLTDLAAGVLSCRHRASDASNERHSHQTLKSEPK
ncbi:hypothetical protein H8A97_29545 [Bradyrhizobium sp. Arg62]|uniref:hypothetical protein n=1 Tax=Bradyrhizobium brasilense TaxID=1419277 RepID=UPI001E56960C|nr:hypothetical protein [Bradyrhizobium brasilense]MCC8949135.1 hypothetical protein [Bradyrhizobium brasilense]